MIDPRVELAAALRAAGLVEKADALLAEVVREHTGAPSRETLEGSLARIRASADAFRVELGLPPRIAKLRKPRRRPGVGRARIKVASMLCELGFVVEPAGIWCAVGWHRSIHKEHDDTTVTWEARADYERDYTIDGKVHRITDKIHLISWCRLTDCARGLDVHPLHGHLQQCVTARPVTK